MECCENTGRQIPIADRIVHPAYLESEFTNYLVIYRLDEEIDLPYYIELEQDPSKKDSDDRKEESLTVLGFGVHQLDNHIASAVIFDKIIQCHRFIW